MPEPPLVALPCCLVITVFLAWVWDGAANPPVNLPAGPWELTVELNHFYILNAAGASTGNTTMGTFVMNLDLRTAPARNSFPTIPVANWSVNNMSLTQASGISVVAATGPSGAVYGWEWAAVLAGNFDGSNIAAARSRADLLWSYVHPF